MTFQHYYPLVCTYQQAYYEAMMGHLFFQWRMSCAAVKELILSIYRSMTRELLLNKGLDSKYNFPNFEATMSQKSA